MGNDNADYSMKGGAVVGRKRARNSDKRARNHDEEERDRKRPADKKAADKRTAECAREISEISELDTEYLVFLIELLNGLDDKNEKYLTDQNMYFGNPEPRPRINQLLHFFEVKPEEDKYSITCGDKTRHCLNILERYRDEISNAIDCISMPPPNVEPGGPNDSVPRIIRHIQKELREVPRSDMKIVECIDKAWTSLNRHHRKLALEPPQIVYDLPNNKHGYNIFNYIVDVGIDELIRLLKKVKANNPLAQNLFVVLTAMTAMPLNSTKLALLLICTNISLKILYYSYGISKQALDIIRSFLTTLFVLLKHTGEVLVFGAVRDMITRLNDDIVNTAIDGRLDEKVRKNLNALKFSNGNPLDITKQSVNDLNDAFGEINNPTQAIITAILGGGDNGANKVHEASSYRLSTSSIGAQPVTTDETMEGWFRRKSSGGLRRQLTIGHYPGRHPAASGLGAASDLGAASGLGAAAPAAASGLGAAAPAPAAASGLGAAASGLGAGLSQCYGVGCVAFGGAIKTKRRKPKSSKGKSKKHLKVKKSKKSKNSTKKKIQRKKPKKPLSASRRSQ